jgi:hypothetical protein
MPEQVALFHDSIHDAVGAVVAALGGKKKVATQLWPRLKPETAYTRLAHCLSDEFPEKLAPDELLFLARAGREIGCHSIVKYMAEECGYAPPEPVDPLDETDTLRREIRDGLAALNRKVDRLERVEIKAGIRVAG